MAGDTSETLGPGTCDARLGELASAGDEHAFTVLAERYRPALACYCRRLGVPADEIDEVIDAAYVTAWGAMRAGACAKPLHAWLYRIAHRHAAGTMTSPSGGSR